MVTESSGVVESSSSPPRSTLLTFLIADVRGYTRFTAEHGDEAAARLAQRFAEIAREVVTAHHGDVIELRGDEALCVFPSARSALRCALALQRAFGQALAADPSLPLTVGIGLDAGEAVPVNGGYRGGALNLAARLCSLAGPGEVLASEGVTHLAGKIEGLTYRDRGQAELKGFADPVAVRDVLEAREPKGEEAPAVAGQGEAQPPSQELPIGGFLGSLPANPLVARGKEIGQLVDAAGGVTTGAGRLVMLAGEPGAGKTRLAQEVTLNVRNRGFLVAAGRCYEPEQTVPYYPFLDALATVWAAAPDAVKRGAAQRWPYLGALLPDYIEVPRAAQGSGQDEQQRVFRAATGFLESVAAIQPLAILLDDLHWADSGSLKLLLHLARHTRTMPILLLGTYRDVEVGRQHPLEGALRDLHREGLMERLDVRRLDREGTAALVAATMGEEEVTQEFATLMHRRTEGNPYFVQQVLRVLVDRGDVFRKDGVWDRRAIEEIEVPESVRSVVGQRLDRLSKAAQEVLHEASVMGQSFSFDDLLALSERGERELEDALEGATRAGLVRDLGDDTYSFDHALTQQSIYGELPSRRRRRLHLAAGEALEGFPERKRQSRVAEIAWHFLQGDDPERALPWTLRAGDAAAAVFAQTDAVTQYRTAAELARELGDAEREAEALEKQGWMLYLSGRHVDALEPLEQAAQLYQNLADQARYLGTVSRIAEPYWHGGTAQAGIERILPVVRALEAAGIEAAPPGGAAEVYVALADLYFATGRWKDLLPIAETAVPLAAAAGNHRALASAEMHRGLALNRLYRLRESQQAFERAIRSAELCGDAYIHLLAIYLYGSSLDWLGQFDEAERYFRQALDLQGRMQRADMVAFMRMALSYLLIRRGRWGEARNEAERAEEEARGVGESWAASYPLRSLGWLCLLQGERDTGVAYLQESLTMAERIDDFQGILGSQRHLAWLDVREGRPQDAVARLAPLWKQLEEQGLPAVFPVEAQAHIELGNFDRAAELLDGARALVVEGEARLDLVEVLTVSATLATRQRRWDNALHDLEEGLGIAKEIGLPYDEALLLYEYGRMHAAKGEPERARERLEQALAILQRLGAVPDIQRTEQALAESVSGVARPS